MHRRFYSKQNSYLRHEHNRATFKIISLDSVLHRSLFSMYKNDLYSDEKVRRRRSCSIRAGVVGRLPVYALTMSANSAGAHAWMNNQHRRHRKWDENERGGYPERRFCRHRRCHQPSGKRRSLRRSVRARWPWNSAGKACRKDGKMKYMQLMRDAAFVWSYFSSSSSMNPLLSWSMMSKAFFSSSPVLADSPQVLKNFL